MSIQPGRVVARIVDEVARSPRRALPYCVFDESCFCTPAASGEILEVVRVRLPGSRRSHGAAAHSSGESAGPVAPIGDGCTAPFATLLHFWTHALRSSLERRDQLDQLVGIAGFAMCDAVDASSFCGDLTAHAARLAEPWRSAWSPPAEQGIREAYRMIEGDCRRSGVAAADDEWIAWFWSHGCSGHRVHLPVVTVAASSSLHR